MNVLIVGPGALGSLLAALLTRKSARKSPLASIALFDYKKERAEKTARSGISAEGVGGSWQSEPTVYSDIRQARDIDLVILCVKAYDTKKAVEMIKPAVGEKTRILTLQNGLGNTEVISEAVGSEKVIGAVTSLGATLLESGRVSWAGKGETVLGRLDGKIPVEMRAIRELFKCAGLSVRISRDIKGLLWSKLIINVGINALSAIVRRPNGSLLESEYTRSVMRDSVTEAVRVAKKKRVKLIYDDPLAKVEAVCEATAANYSSMLQDILHKKKTEIDFLNGVIVRHAKELGIPVPVNAVLVNIIKALETESH